MNRRLAALTNLVRRPVGWVASLVLDHEPVLTAGAVATVVVKVLVTFGVKTDPGVVTEWVVPVLPIVFSFAARARAWSPAGLHDAIHTVNMANRPGGALPTDPQD